MSVYIHRKDYVNDEAGMVDKLVIKVMAGFLSLNFVNRVELVIHIAISSTT